MQLGFIVFVMVVGSLAHGIRNEIRTNERRNEEDVPLTCRRDEGKREERREKRKEERSGLTKHVIHQKQGGENRQTDPLAGRIHVEEEPCRPCTVSSSDSQNQSLGK